jgi:hypothetical protein
MADQSTAGGTGADLGELLTAGFPEPDGAAAHPSYVEQLVRVGITAVSVEPSAVPATRHALATAEHRVRLEAARATRPPPVIRTAGTPTDPRCPASTWSPTPPARYSSCTSTPTATG